TGAVFPTHLEALRQALNQDATRGFFRSMLFDDARTTLQRLVEKRNPSAAEPNLKNYIDSLRHYPPYQALLQLPKDSVALTHYNNFVSFLHIFAYGFRAIPAAPALYSRMALDAMSAYESIRAQDHEVSLAYIPFFVDILLDTLQHEYYQPVSSSPP